MSLDPSAIRARAEVAGPLLGAYVGQVVGRSAADVPDLLDALDKLAREVWSGVQRCPCPGPMCDRCRGALFILGELGFGHEMAEWAAL